MSVSAISEDAGIFSRLQLAKALKEDPENGNSEPPENSAIFLRQRRNTNLAPQRSSFYIPRPIQLLVPPVLGNVEDNNLTQQNNPPPILPSQQQNQQVRRPSQPQIVTSSPRNSVIIPEERRGSASKPATLLDVRQSMLEVKHNLQNAIPFSTSSSHRTSIILQQHKTFPDANGKPHGASKLNNVTNSRPNSLVVSSSPRPTSSYTNNTNSRPTSFYKSNKSLNQDSEEDENESSKSKSKKSKEIKKSGSSSSNDSDSASKLPPMLPPINSVSNQSITLEKVEEEDDSSDLLEEDDEDEDDDSSEDDTPLALKSTPKIKVAPPRITTRKVSGGGRIEAWLEDVSGSPDRPPSRPSTPGHSPTPGQSPTHSHSPTRAHSPRIRKTSEHSVHQYSSSPLGMGHRMSYIEPVHDARNRRPKSAFVPDDFQVLKPDVHQPRKRSNSEFVPRIRPNSVAYEKSTPIPMGRVSPNPRQDSGYWAKDTLLALSDDLRHINLMNDSNTPNTTSSKNRRASVSNVSGNGNNAKFPISKVINRHRREGSGSRPSSPQMHIPPQGNYLPPTQPSRSKDSLMPAYTNNTNRNSLYVNNNINNRISSEQLMPSNRNSGIYLHQNQQKHRIRS